jgi:hypothetical protein
LEAWAGQKIMSRSSEVNLRRNLHEHCLQVVLDPLPLLIGGHGALKLNEALQPVCELFSGHGQIHT